ncbi:hypothetical protein J6S88_01375 [bacterium]|nr:hypothetical protein [bacterium]
MACVTKPQLHKNVFIYDSNYTVVEQEMTPTETKNLPTMAVTQETTQKAVPKTEQQVTKQTTPAKTQPKTVKQDIVSPYVQTVHKTEEKNPLTDILSKKEVAPQKEVTVAKNETKQEPVTVVQAKSEPQKATVQTMSQAEKERQELILWNVWRSNLQNKIMQDTKLPIIPEGVIFRFKFDVDKYGKISNVQTWSLTPAYTPYAIQYIAPVIRSYQGREILNFPEGSNRFSTTVEGGWKISKTAKYSTPADYKDSEKVISK